jgi:hypothetical protein
MEDNSGDHQLTILFQGQEPRMIEKLMLHVQYECQRRGVQIPWLDREKQLISNLVSILIPNVFTLLHACSEHLILTSPI